MSDTVVLADIQRCMAPFQTGYLKDTHTTYRVTFSHSSVSSKYGVPCLREMIESIKDYFQVSTASLAKAIHSKSAIDLSFNLAVSLSTPLRSINCREAGFKNNNYGYFVQGLYQIQNYECPERMQTDLEAIEISNDSRVIIEGVNFKHIHERMSTPADYIMQLVKQQSFNLDQLICLNEFYEYNLSNKIRPRFRFRSRSCNSKI